MYTLKYQDKDEKYENHIELMKKLTELGMSGDFNHQLVVVEKEKEGYMEIALGMEDKSILIYTPENEDCDCILSCNSSIQKATVDELIIKDLGNEEVHLTSSDTVSLENAFKVVLAYLQGQDFKTIIDWYAY